jgi:hypothetical protein
MLDGSFSAGVALFLTIASGCKAHLPERVAHQRFYAPTVGAFSSLRFSNSEDNFGCESAIPRRDLPELCMNHAPLKNRGRGECRVPNAPAASRAMCRKHTS